MALYTKKGAKLSFFFHGYEENDKDWLYYSIRIETSEGLVFPKRTCLSSLYIKDDLPNLYSAFEQVLFGLSPERQWACTEIGCTEFKIIKKSTFYTFEVLEEYKWGSMSARIYLDEKELKQFYSQLCEESIQYKK